MKLPPTKDAEECDLPLTRHGGLRQSERRIGHLACMILLEYGDLKVPSRGAEKRRLSRRTARRLERKGLFTRRDIVEAREVTMILASDGRIVTAYRNPADMRFRRSGLRPVARRLWRHPEETE